MNTNIKNTLKLLEERDCLSPEELQGYLADKLSAQAKRSVEAHLLDCPLCNDAVEGLMQSKTQVSIADLRASRLHGSSSGNARIWLAAASLLFIAAVGSWLFNNFKQEPSQEALALKQENASTSSVSVENTPNRTSDQVVPHEENRSEHTKQRAVKERTTESLESKAKDKAPATITIKQAEKAKAGISADAEVTTSAAIAIAEAPTVVDAERASAPIPQKKTMAAAAPRSATLAEEAQTARDAAREKGDIKDLYARGQYQALLDNYKNDNSQEALLIKGKSHYKLQHYREALQTLQKVSSAQFLYEAEWVSANCYLELNKTSKAKTLFEKLSKEAGPHQKEAEERNKKLE